MAWNGRVQTVVFTWMSKLLEKEPDYYADNRNEKLYEFSNGRQFRGDPRKVATAYPDE